jgi:hypothetical protein
LDYDPSPTGIFNKNSKSDPLPVPAISDFLSLPNPEFYFRQDITTPVDIKDTAVYVSSSSSPSTSVTSHTDEIFTGFYRDDLRKEGYKFFEITVAYQRTIPATVSSVTATRTGTSSGPNAPITYSTNYSKTSITNAGSQNLKLQWGLGNGGPVWDSYGLIYDVKTYNSDEWIVHSTTVPIDRFSTEFTLHWSASKSNAGSGENVSQWTLGGHEWTLGHRKIMVTPLKTEKEE